MFLLDTAAVRDWAGIEEELRRLCGRIGANLLVAVKYDERKLAYEIKKRKRGTYVLAYFEADPEKLSEMERDIRLSEVVLRALLIRKDQLSEEELTRLRSLPAEQPLAPLASGEGRRHDDDRRQRRDRYEGGGGGGGRDMGGPDMGGVESAPEEANAEL
jgi:ribosomal protein S6